MNLKIAILITCYNRLETTKECLKHCFSSLSFIESIDHDIFLLDDNSPDKTGEVIKKMYPKINVRRDIKKTIFEKLANKIELHFLTKNGKATKDNINITSL